MSVLFVSRAISTDEVDPVNLKTCVKPVGTREDDVLLGFVWVYEEEIISAPTGWVWTGLGGAVGDVAGEPEVFNRLLYYKIATDAEPSDYTFETTTDTGPAPNRRVVIAAYRGCKLPNPFSPSASGFHGHNTHVENGGSNILPIQGFGSGLGDLGSFKLVVMAAVGTTSPTATMPSPWVQRLDQSGNFIFDRVIPHNNAIPETELTVSVLATSWGIEVPLIPQPNPGDRNYCGSVDTQIN